MPDSRKFIAAISIVLGVVLFLLGIASIGFYIYSVVDVLEKADQSFFTLKSQLILIEDKQQTITNLSNNASLTSAGKLEFSLDTFTKDMEVKLNDFRPINR